MASGILLLLLRYFFLNKSRHLKSEVLRGYISFCYMLKWGYNVELAWCSCAKWYCTKNDSRGGVFYGWNLVLDRSDHCDCVPLGKYFCCD